MDIQTSKWEIRKRLVHLVIGVLSFPGLVWFNRMQIRGMEHLAKLPAKRVLFVSNHQTYFSEVITFLHIFSAVKWGYKKRLGLPFYLLDPFLRVNYVAAGETMRKNFLSRLFLLAGGITVKRAWRTSGDEKIHGLDISDSRKIHRALEENWIINFPQGTTSPYAPGRKGTARIMKQMQPIVIPVVIDGFSRAFNKTGLKMKRWGTRLSVTFKEPLVYDPEASQDDLMQLVMDAIEQSAQFYPRQLTSAN
jgi:1-acyl-sn-glycerol-3-phosphate acyltransferase